MTSERGIERWRRAFGGLSRGVRRVTDLVPITPLGLIVAVVGWAALTRIGLAERDLVLVVAAGGALGLVGVALVLVILGAIRIKHASFDPRGTRERTLETERSLPTGFSLPGLFLVPMLQVRWEWLAPEARLETRRRGLRVEEDASLRARGIVPGIERRIIVQDAFGLARIAVRQRSPERLTVLPHAGAMRDLPLLVSMAGGDDVPHPMGLDDGDRVELRRYAPGDPARHIHWKVFGRTRKLMVKMPERALSRARRTVSYLVGGPDDEASAAAARVAIEGGAFGAEWIFGADGSDGEASAIGDAVQRVVTSAGIGERGGSGLRAFVDRAERTGPASLVLFAPPRPGPWLARVLAVLRGRAGRARVVIGVDGIDSSSKATWWQRVIAREAPRVGTPIDELDAVLGALAATRCEVVVIDRRSGRRLGTAHRGAARALAADGKQVAA
ncbi:DUF58 domain-containing protein [Sandaracinus amylolyticus]|nr:DUF58 domain-containing protein [Sandaracinus amylolyticus]